jgi:WD40 repeat protein
MSVTLKDIYAPSIVTERGKPVHIGGDPKDKKRIAYCAGKGVFIRETANHLKCFMYSEHKSNTTVARISPTGFYVASGDVTGKVLIWDLVGQEHITKLDKQSVGALADMAWSPDGQRVVVGGQGRERFGEAFMMDGGASVGEITGHAKPITSVDFRKERPFRAVTASEDFKVNWFPGPPFKYEKSLADHTRYVNCVRISPDGNKMVSVGSDKKGFVYDGKTADKIGELAEKDGHQGGIYGVAWSPDSKRILTASADKTCKVWNMDTYQVEKTFTMGNDVNDQQLGCLWQGSDLISISLRGDIIFLDEANPAKPKKVLYGHNKNITTLAFDAASGKVFTGDFGGALVEWNVSNGDSAVWSGAAHTTQITQAVVNGDGKLVTISVDDTVKISSIAHREWAAGVALGTQPISVAARKDSTIVGTADSVIVLGGNNILKKTPVKYQVTAIAISPDGSEVALGGSDNVVRVHAFDGSNLTEKHALTGHNGALTSLVYSHDGALLAASDTNREVKVWRGKESVVPAGSWVFHNSRVEAVAWSPDNQHVASVGNDSQVIVWDSKDFNKKIIVKNAHQGVIKAVAWTDAQTVLTAGQDMTIKSWSVKY